MSVRFHGWSGNYQDSIQIGIQQYFLPILEQLLDETEESETMIQS